MTTLHVQVILPARSGLTKDEALNTFTFTTAVGVEDSVAAIDPVLDDFYNAASGIGLPVASFIGQSRVRAAGACSRRYYDITAHLNGTSAGPPVAVTPWSLGAPSESHDMPEEVALALSFHGADSTIPEFGPGTRPKSRHRGRVYLGPLVPGAMESSGPLYWCRPTDAIKLSWADAGEAMKDAAIGWAVWSRRNAATYPVVAGWVDDAFDTIRKRGPEMTEKTPWGVPV